MKKYKLYIISLLCVFLPLLVSSVYADDAVFDTIMSRIRISQWEKVTDVNSLNTTVSNLLNSIKANGSWDDLDYSSTAMTDWPGTTHLERLKDMALAYTLKSSGYYKDGNLHQKIIDGLTFFFNRNPTSSNWFVHEVGNPQRLGLTLLLMRDENVNQIPQYLETNILSRIKSTGGDPETRTGANKVDIAIHWVYRGCLTKNHDVLSHGVEHVFYPLFMTTLEGLQHDYAYFQHGQQLYTGGYGVSYVRHSVDLAVYTADTQYALNEEKTNLLIRFFKDHFLSIIRGRSFLYNIVGRNVALSGGLGASYVANLVSSFKKLDPSNASVYDAATSRLRGGGAASHQVPTRHYHYWRGDYTLYTSPGYTFDIRMASTRTARNENGNGQNLKGYFLTEGAYSILLDGSEYTNIFPVWNWSRIPGTTLPQKTTIPKPPQWSQPGNATFSGGVSNGEYGVTVYTMKNFEYQVNTEAKKSWFLFGKEIVCLGSGINSTAVEEINTTINQCMQNGAAYVKQKNNESYVQLGSTSYRDDLEWMHHGKVAYFFPSRANLNLSFAAQTGSWYSIATSESKSTLSHYVFNAWINHGAKPKNAKYEYIIVPNKTLSQTKTYDISDIEIVSNQTDIQAVYHKKLNLWGMVFYEAGIFENDDFSLTVDAPCVLMMEGPENQFQGWLADPTQNSSEIKIIFYSKSDGKSHEINLTLPQMPYAGSTVEFKVDIISSNKEIKNLFNQSQGHLAPNPVKRGENTSLYYNASQNQNIDLKIYDTLGKKLLDIKTEVKTGENKINIETGSLMPGHYLVHIEQNQLFKTSRQLIIN